MYGTNSWVGWATIALGLGMVLSGCTGPSGESADETADGPAGGAEFDETTGSVQGQVLTDDLVPLKNAQVGIETVGIFANTDADGLFYLNKVPPGEHTVAATAFGYQTSTIDVAVTAGQVTDPVALLLSPVPGAIPYHRTTISRVELTGAMWKLTPECIYEPLTSLNPLLKTCGGIRFECGDPDMCEQHTSDDKFFAPEWETVIGEVNWQPSSAATGKGYHFDINAPNITRGSGGSINQAEIHTWPKDGNVPPLLLRVDKDGLAERGIPESDWNNYPNDDCTAPDPAEVGNCDWFWRLFPAACHLGNCNEGFGPDYGISYENPVDVYFTYFILEPAPTDFTAIPEQ